MSRRLLAGSSRGWLFFPFFVSLHTPRLRSGGAEAGADAARLVRLRTPIPRPGSWFAIRMTLLYCSGCHVRDSAGYLQRISYERKTPEGWEMTVRRMVALNNVKLDPAAARTIVRYLSDNQGLAPAELRPGRFETRAADDRVSLYRRSANRNDVPRLPFDWAACSRSDARRRSGSCSSPRIAVCSPTPTFRRSAAAVRRRTTVGRCPTRWTWRSIISPACFRYERRNGPRGRRRCARRTSKARGC